MRVCWARFGIDTGPPINGTVAIAYREGAAEAALDLAEGRPRPKNIAEMAIAVVDEGPVVSKDDTDVICSQIFPR